MSKLIDLTGQKFGRLTVLYRVKNYDDGKARWHCKCECGNEVDVCGNAMRSGKAQSCGCLQKERISESNYKNKRKSNEYICFDDYIIAKTSTGIEFLIDKDDEWVLKNFCWHVNKHGYVNAFAYKGNTNQKKVILHRLITKCDDKMVVDHINGNKLDNRKCNLRITSQQQNCMNRKISSNNTSGVTGVSFNSQSSKWQAYIYFNNKQVNLGFFDSIEDAIATRKLAEEKYFGEYSYDNSRHLNNLEETTNGASP